MNTWIYGYLTVTARCLPLTGPAPSVISLGRSAPPDTDPRVAIAREYSRCPIPHI